MYREKTTYIGFGNICDFRYPLGLLEHSPYDKWGDYCLPFMYNEYMKYLGNKLSFYK